MKELIVILLASGVFAYGCWRSRKEDTTEKDDSSQYLVQRMECLSEEMKNTEAVRQRLQAEIVRRLDSMEARISDVEIKIRNASTDRNSMSARNYDEVQQKINLLSERISQIQTSQANVDNDQDESRTRGKSRRSASNCDKATTTIETEEPRESADDLKRRLKENDMEIKRLREQNPACVLNTIDPPSNIRNTIMKYTTLKDKQYCTKAQITYVRDLFYCTKCHRELQVGNGPCCNVSRKKSFAEWRQKRLDVEKTKEIREKIDGLLRENQEIKERLKQR